MSFSLNALYRELNLTKQAVHSYKKKQNLFDRELEQLVMQADIIKSEHPGCGVEKLYYTLKPKFLGRDAFCEIFLSLGYGVRRIKNYRRTTIPSHINYPNLIEGMLVDRPYQVLQSDITYFDVAGKFYYLVFVTDIYSREIMGYYSSNNLRTEANLKALKMALLKKRDKQSISIHHSDRGSQYGSQAYRALLKANQIEISMGECAQDNAYAERVNGIIKNEYLRYWSIDSEYKLKSKLKRAVSHYNTQRKHRAFDMRLSPVEFRESLVNLNPQERPKVIVYARGKPDKIIGTLSPSGFTPREGPQAHICPLVNNKNY